MRIRRAIVKTVKWGGPVVAVVVAVAWLLYRDSFVGWSARDKLFFSVGSGEVSLDYWPKGASRLSSRTSNPAPTPDWSEWGFVLNWTAPHSLITIPLWFLFAITAGPGALASLPDIRAARRRKLGHCPKCNYSRAGLAPAAPCPECGAAATIK